MIDWQQMFRRYAEHVGEQEGTYFLSGPGERNVYGVEKQTPWTPEEWAAIEALMNLEPAAS